MYIIEVERQQVQIVSYIRRLLKTLPARWSELEEVLGVNKKVLRDMLRSLEGAMIIAKIGNTYTIPDPVLKKIVHEL